MEVNGRLISAKILNITIFEDWLNYIMFEFVRKKYHFSFSDASFISNRSFLREKELFFKIDQRKTWPSWDAAETITMKEDISSGVIEFLYLLYLMRHPFLRMQFQY